MGDETPGNVKTASFEARLWLAPQDDDQVRLYEDFVMVRCERREPRRTQRSLNGVARPNLGIELGRRHPSGAGIGRLELMLAFLQPLVHGVEVEV